MVAVYSQFKPTGFDSHIQLEGLEDWLVAPVSRNRDSGALEVSNFETSKAELNSKGLDYEIHRFGHWGPGWFEIILVDPTDKARTLLDDLERALENYPILDETDYSNREWIETVETFNNCTRLDLASYIQREFGLVGGELEYFVKSKATLEDWLEALDQNPNLEGPDSLWRIFQRIVDRLDRAEFARLVWRLREAYRNR